MPSGSFTKKPGRAVSRSFPAIVLGLLAIGELPACYLHGGQMLGLQTAHPLSIPVSVATRRAIESGELPEIPQSSAARREAALQRFTLVFGLFGQISQGHKAPPAPAFSVFLTESGLWTRFSFDDIQGWKVQQHRSGPTREDLILVAADTLMAALLRGEFSVERAANSGLLDTDASTADARDSLMAFDTLISAFRKTPYARFRLTAANPGMSFTDALPVSPYPAR